jgi:AcrR family transcriptional regulator
VAKAAPARAKAAPAQAVSRRLHPTAQKILAASKRILAERGYQGLTLQAISAESGVNKAGVWYYFGGKQQLVLALLEEVTVAESFHFGAHPAADATLDARVDLIVGSTAQVEERVRRYTAFYQLLPEASRDAALREHLITYYQGWYAWAHDVLVPAGAGTGKRSRTGPRTRTSETIGQFASVLLDGIFMQMVVAAPDFDLAAALAHARETLRHLLTEEPERA